MEVIKTAHSVYRIKYHVVWVCKYSRQILKPAVCSYIRKMMPTLLRRMPGVQVEPIVVQFKKTFQVVKKGLLGGKCCMVARLL